MRNVFREVGGELEESDSVKIKSEVNFKEWVVKGVKFVEVS